jgi:hypothetical protein
MELSNRIPNTRVPQKMENQTPKLPDSLRTLRKTLIRRPTPQNKLSKISHPYQAVCPPSILKSLPVIKLLASLMQNTAAPLYSSGTLSFPSIFCVGQSRLRSGYFSNRASTMAVAM